MSQVALKKRVEVNAFHRLLQTCAEVEPWTGERLPKMNPPQETLHRLHSAHLDNERTIWIRTPRDPAAAAHLTIFLDAEIYRDRVGAVAVIDGLDNDSAITNSWFVFVSMESVAARWIECPCHPPFARFVNDELLAWLEALHPAIASCRERVLVGLSYTGLAAAYVAINSRGRFARVVAQSGSFWWNNCWLVEHVRNRPDLSAASFHFDVGLRETADHVQHKEDVLQVVPQLEGVRRMSAALRERGLAVHEVEFDGGHDCAEWKITLPGALRWVLPVDPVRTRS